jgi:metal transporter CNNM
MTLIEIATWAGIVLCLSQSAMFSGLNLAFFSVSRLQLEAEAEQGKAAARRILDLRRDANFLLCTILWGNVSVNVLLALLSESIMAGVGGFVFSTAGITFIGEIIPQAYFSRNAMRMGALLAPVIRFYQLLLYPFAKPCSLFLDAWVGPEGPNFMRERDVEIILQKHISEEGSEIGAAEGRGALNFLDLDDRSVENEGTSIDPGTVFAFEARLDLPLIPEPESEEGKDFLEALKKNDHKWVIITDTDDRPQLVLDAEAYMFNRYAGRSAVDVYHFCHRPIVVSDPETTIETVLPQLQVDAESRNDRIIDNDVILFWGESNRRIVTGADILGRLLQGIVHRIEPSEKAN